MKPPLFEDYTIEIVSSKEAGECYNAAREVIMAGSALALSLVALF